jgi:hypothetical protein
MSKMISVVACALAALAGSAQAQVAQTVSSATFPLVPLATWTDNLDATAPTFQRPAVLGVNTPSTSLSGTGTAVRYGANTFNFATADQYVIGLSWNRVGASGNQLQMRYNSSGFNPASALTNNLGGVFLAPSATGTFNYVINAPAGPMTFVSAWSTNTASFGTMTTTISQDSGLLRDAGPMDAPTTSSFTASSASTDTIITLDSITIRGLQHTWYSDLAFSLSNGVSSITFLQDTSGSGLDYNGDYTFVFGGAAFPTTGTAIPAGTYGSTADFTTFFAGASVGGPWTLSVVDRFSGDIGRLNSFELNFTVVPTPGAAALLGLGGLAVARRRRA